MLYSEFRDGNVPAEYERLRVLKDSLDHLPPGMKKVFLRPDPAGYQKDLLLYCGEGRDERFGVIEFAVGADVNDVLNFCRLSPTPFMRSAMKAPRDDPRRDRRTARYGGR